MKMIRMLLSGNAWIPLWKRGGIYKPNFIAAHQWSRRIVRVCENGYAHSSRNGGNAKVLTKLYSQSSNPKEEEQSDSKQLDNISSEAFTEDDVESSKKGEPSKPDPGSNPPHNEEAIKIASQNKLQSDFKQLHHTSTKTDIESSKVRTDPPHDQGDPSKTNAKPPHPKNSSD